MDAKHNDNHPEPDLQKELKSFKNANAFKDKLFSIIGHDLRSPFNSIRGLLMLLEDDLITPAERKTLIGELKITIDNSLQTLDNLLGWASQKHYGTVLNAATKDERLNLYELVNRTIFFVRHTAAKKNITLVNDVPQDIYIYADLEQLSFILRNLTGNAIKFSYENTSVIMSAYSKGKMVEIAVIDSGVGMTDDDIRSLFQIDTRSSRQGTDNEKGTGLGLIFCKEFVDNNGGEIWVESNGRNGCAFKFTVRSQIPH